MCFWWSWQFWGVWLRGFPSDSAIKESACSTGDLGSIPGWGRSPGGVHGNPLQYSCLENPVDSGAWQAIVHRVTKSQTRLKRFILACMHGQVFCNISLNCFPLMVFLYWGWQSGFWEEDPKVGVPFSAHQIKDAQCHHDSPLVVDAEVNRRLKLAGQVPHCTLTFPGVLTALLGTVPRCTPHIRGPELGPTTTKWGCRSEVNKQARLVEREVCFISVANNLGERLRSVQRPTPPTPIIRG